MEFTSTMRFILAVLSMVPLSSTHAATYFVAPGGSDGNTGAKDKPFASWAKAQSAVSAGDTVLFRGGAYTYTKAIRSCGSQTDNVNAISLDKSGSAGARIHYMAYPGENPIFDFFKMADDCRIRGVYVPGSYIHIKGLELRGVPQNNNRNHESWCIYIKGSHNIFELLDTHHNMGPGINIWGGDDNLVLNCDSHDNFDEYTSNGAGESADGFGVHTDATGAAGNTFRGCRAWWNSDDGYDCISNKEAAIFENCWAWNNGYKPGTTTAIGNGNGFKLGGYGLPPTGSPSSPPRNIARHCLSFLNRSAGFYQNHHTADNVFYNNTAYKNGVNFNMLGYSSGDRSMGIYKNNIAFAGSATGNGPGTQATNNSWNLPSPPAASDFMSIDTAGVYGPRKADGSLPDVDFMRLAGGKYVDNGVDVGLDYTGAAPDLGAFEKGAVSGLAFRPARKRALLKKDLSGSGIHSLLLYDFAGRRFISEMNGLPRKPFLYPDKEKGAATGRP